MKRLLLLVFLLAGCGHQSHVVYEVHGTTPTAIVSFDAPEGKDVNLVMVHLPWSFEFDASSGQNFFLSARNPYTPTTVVCTITVDGTVLYSDTHTGDNTMAICGDG